MTNSEALEYDAKELLRLTNRLKSILDDPHPGLLTWQMAVAAALAELTHYATWGANPYQD